MTQQPKKRSGADLVFPNFDDIEVSTKTFTVNTNLNINLEKLYNTLSAKIDNSAAWFDRPFPSVPAACPFQVSRGFSSS